jgi:hypothetical protein
MMGAPSFKTPHVSAHALVRWLERVKRVDIEAVRARMITAGIPQPVDGGIITFLQDAKEIDRAAIEAEILTEITRTGIELGACGIRRAGLRLVLRGSCVVTVLGPHEDAPDRPIYPYRGAI